MKYLLDTCVISELIAKQPNQNVVRWVDELDPNRVYLSVVTIGEIQKGIQQLPASRRKTELTEWLTHELLSRFAGRIAIIDTGVMLAWGELTGKLETAGKRMPAIDSLIAAIALHGSFHLVTRNEEDFKHTHVPTLNPWRL